MQLSWQTIRHYAWPVILFLVILEIVLIHFMVVSTGLNANVTQKNHNYRKTARVLQTNTSATQTENRKVLADTPSLDLGEEEKHVEPSNKTKPLLVFHIGPHKTGTTTIQEQLQFLQSTIYTSHNIVYLGRCHKRGCRQEEGQNRTLPPFLTAGSMRTLAEHCLRRHSQRRPCTNNTNWKTVFEYIKALEPWMRNDNTAFLLSEENFGLGHVDTMPMFAAELSQWFRVRLVLTYRHFFEWVPSWYYENYRRLERVVPPFVDYWRHYGSQRTNNKYELPAWEERVHPVTHLYNGWKPLVDEIVVFDMHNQRYNGSKDLLTSFMESAFPEYLFDKNWKGGRNFPTDSNRGGNVDWRVLTCAVATQGLFNATFPVVHGAPLSRTRTRLLWQAAHEIKMGMEAMGMHAHDLPQECLNETELQDLFELSQHLGATVPGSSNFLDYDRSALRFQQAVDNHKFCNVDTQKLLQNETLRSLIQSL